MKTKKSTIKNENNKVQKSRNIVLTVFGFKKSFVFFQCVILSLFLLCIITTKSHATQWSSVVNLSGAWSFTVGDNPEWANPKTDISDWDRIFVPGKWEDFYPGYNGYAWYRKNFDMKPYPKTGKIWLLLGKIDDVDEVYINGVKIGQTGSFFPNYQSAYNIERKYPIPNNLLKNTGNVIAVRVYDEALEGGIVHGDEIGIFYDNDHALLSFDLSGGWKFSIYRETGITRENFNDKDWDVINVPQSWESQGYLNHDGTAWYRKEFMLTRDLQNEELYLSLGKIDDLDKVFLNGVEIGRTQNLAYYDRFRKSDAWRMYRVYKIPTSLLKAKNVLVVEVYDDWGEGGIYEGPVGLVTKKNARIIEDRNRENYHSNPFRAIIRSFTQW